MVVVRQTLVILVTGTLGFSGVAFGQALSAGDPPGRVGRLAFTQGTVSFHDAERTDWEAAVVNTPLTTGDSLWTEPNAHAEVSIAGSRVRMDGATQLDMATIDDRSTRLQVDQGRIDVKTFAYDAKQPYDLITPRGVATLQQQGDYYVEAGSTQDPTRLGVRAGAAQFQAPDGRVLAVRAGEVAEITGDGSSMELHTIQSPPPPMPQYWAARDKQVVYDQPPQYLSAGVTGYEDLNHYGAWQNDPEYGQVWYARDVPSGWQPYSTGRWDYQPVYGWTWIDEQPWGFAPYHYGRWAQRNNRWFWVPPARTQPAVYAPALVAFVGGTELALALGVQNRQPVGWFPLGPREAYVPPYTTNRDYYRRLNLANRVQDRVLEDRWASVQRRDGVVQQQNFMNRRFTTVVPAETFARSQPVQRAALQVSADKVATAPVAAVAAPPQPNQSIRALMAPTNQAAPTTAQRSAAPSAPAAPTAPNQVAPSARTGFAAVQAIQPERQQAKAPGPEVVSRSAVTANTSTDAKVSTDAKPALPKLEPRNAAAPPLPQIQGERRPATLQAGPQQATVPANQPAATPPKPGEPQANAPVSRPGAPPLPGEPNRAPPQANTAPNAAPNAPLARPQAAPAPQPPKPGEAPKPPQAQAPQPPKPPQAMSAPQPPQPQHQPAPPPPPQHQATPPAPQPQQQLQRQPAAPPPQQQTHVAPPPQPQAPPPQMQRQAAPQMQQHAAPPPPPQRQAAPPPPPPQHQAAPPPRPAPAPAPQQAQQAPHPQPAPQPAPKPPGQPKPDEKK